MEKPKPLSYSSTKSVIQYLNPNFRFRLSHQCPSLLSTEKSVPLRLVSLRLNRYQFLVNETKYNLHVRRHGNDVTEERNIHRNVVVEDDPDEILVNLRGNEDIDRPENNKRILEDRRHYYLVLTVGTRSEVLIYERNLHEAMKYLIKQIFSGRVIVKVDELSIACRIVLRIPASLKFQVHNLQLICTDNNQLFEAIKPILDFSTPLSSITFHFDHQINYEDPIIRSSKTLYFDGYFLLLDNDLDNLIKLRHKRVHLSLKPSSRWQNVPRLIDNWIEVERDAGFYYSLEINEEIRAKEILETVMINHKERIIERPNEDPNSVLLYMNYTSDLHISYDLRETHCLMHLRVQPRY